MIFSAQQLFSNDQAITASAVSTNVIDLGAPETVLGAPAALSQDIGKGVAVPILVQVVTAFATLTSLTVTLQKDTVEGFGSAETVDVTPAIPVASLVAGYKFPWLWLPLGIDQQYVRLSYTVGGSNATAGAIKAGIVMGVQTA